MQVVGLLLQASLLFVLGAQTIVLLSHFGHGGLTEGDLRPYLWIVLLGFYIVAAGFRHRADWQERLLTTGMAPLLDRHLLLSVGLGLLMFVMLLALVVGWLGLKFEALNQPVFVTVLTLLSLSALLIGSYLLWLDHTLGRLMDRRRPWLGRSLTVLLGGPLLGEVLVTIETAKKPELPVFKLLEKPGKLHNKA